MLVFCYVYLLQRLIGGCAFGRKEPDNSKRGGLFSRVGLLPEIMALQQPRTCNPDLCCLNCVCIKLLSRPVMVVESAGMA